jgi:predicted Rossmann fold nucleotide-binding protein DprA/Smf involved in DNA uptake
MTNRDALILLCSQLSVGQQHKPFSNVKISQLIIKLSSLGLELRDLSHKTFEELKLLFYPNREMDEKGLEVITQIMSLLSREGSMAFAFMELKKWGIEVLTKFDKEYPQRFIKELGSSAPALFYYAGNKELLKEKYIGFTGSRLKKTNTEDEAITKAWAHESIQQGYGIVSGGASGIDSFSTQVAIQLKKPFIEWLSDSLIKRLQINAISLSLQHGNGLLLSESIPTAPFNVGFAMARNKFIYITAEKVIAIKAEYTIKGKEKSGGTWNGAIENLRSNYKKLYVINDANCKGNVELIEMGGIPIAKYPLEKSEFLPVKIATEKPLKEETIVNVIDDMKILEVIKELIRSKDLKLTAKEQTSVEELKDKILASKSLIELMTFFPQKLYKKINNRAMSIISNHTSVQTKLF